MELMVRYRKRYKTAAISALCATNQNTYKIIEHMFAKENDKYMGQTGSER